MYQADPSGALDNHTPSARRHPDTHGRSPLTESDHVDPSAGSVSPSRLERLLRGLGSIDISEPPAWLGRVADALFESPPEAPRQARGWIMHDAGPGILAGVRGAAVTVEGGHYVFAADRREVLVSVFGDVDDADGSAGASCHVLGTVLRPPDDHAPLRIELRAGSSVRSCAIDPDSGAFSFDVPETEVRELQLELIDLDGSVALPTIRYVPDGEVDTG